MKEHMMTRQFGDHLTCPAAAEGSGVSLLYVDDNPHDLFFAQEAIRQTGLDIGFTCFDNVHDARVYLGGAARTGGHILRAARSAFLLDFYVGVENSLGLLRWIRSKRAFSSIPVFIYSDSDSEGPISACYASGANHFLTKAASLERLSVIMGLLYHGLVSQPPDFGKLRRMAEYRSAPAVSGQPALVERAVHTNHRAR